MTAAGWRWQRLLLPLPATGKGSQLSLRRKFKASERKCSSSPKLGCSTHQCKRPLKASCPRADVGATPAEVTRVAPVIAAKCQGRQTGLWGRAWTSPGRHAPQAGRAKGAPRTWLLEASASPTVTHGSWHRGGHSHPSSDEVTSPPAASLRKLLLWNGFALLLTGSTDL